MVLKLDGEIAQQGVRVTLEIGAEGQRPIAEVAGDLPSNPELIEALYQWQDSYRALETLSRLTPKPPVDPETVQAKIERCRSLIEHCRGLAEVLCDRTHTWLQSPTFRPIDTTLREELSPSDIIRVLIRTQNPQLRQLPWQRWDFFERYTQAEFALSATEIRRPRGGSDAGSIGRDRKPKPSTVRILAILGHSSGINIHEDRQLLENLPNASVTFLPEPHRQDINDQLWDRPWDILFFAGHSQTEGNTGWIEINPQDRLTIEELKYCLKKAIAQGLQLAIFNSCDGLGLVRELEQLHLPQTIVMREPVPDQVAQEFLKAFLTAFSRGDSLYQAERQARERLHVLENQFPCASWLPVICQNPAIEPLRWQDLHVPAQPEPIPQPSQKIPWKKRLQVLIGLSLVATSFIMGLRFLGALQTSELRAFDHLMRMRPPESLDDRLLIVEVSEEDIRKFGHPLPDKILLQLLKKLQSYNPAAIGLDIVRDQPVPKDDLNTNQALVDYFKQNDNIIPICAFGQHATKSIAPLLDLKKQQIGFVDLFSDRDLDPYDDTVRRYLLSHIPISFSICSTSYSLAWQLVYQYLERNQRTVKTFKKNWQFGSVVTRRLENRSGGYQALDDYGSGSQLPIFYRKTPNIARRITVQDFLTDKLYPHWIEDRVVLIGVTATSIPDYHNTPYGRMRGLFVHAHVVSQLLSAVEDKRPLVWWWPWWVDTLWIMGWSLASGIAIWKFQKPLYRCLSGSFATIALYGSCWLFIIQGGWIPLLPTALAAVLTGTGTIVYNRCKKH